MRHIIPNCVVCGLFVAVACTHAAVVKGPPPVPPPPPPLFGDAAGQPPAAITLANASADSVLLLADTLALVSLSTQGTIADENSARVVELSNGATIRLDNRTPAGNYVLASGLQVHVLPGSGYPRAVEYAIYRAQTLRFQVRSAGRVGVYVSSPGQEHNPQNYLLALARGLYGSAFSENDSAAAYECTQSGVTTGGVSLGASRVTPVTLTWYAYDDIPGSNISKPVSGLRMVAGHAEWKASMSSGPRSYPLALTRSVPVHGSELRQIGQVTINPLSNTITAQ